MKLSLTNGIPAGSPLIEPPHSAPFGLSLVNGQGWKFGAQGSHKAISPQSPPHGRPNGKKVLSEPSGAQTMPKEAQDAIGVLVGLGEKRKAAEVLVGQGIEAGVNGVDNLIRWALAHRR